MAIVAAEDEQVETIQTLMLDQLNQSRRQLSVIVVEELIDIITKISSRLEDVALTTREDDRQTLASPLSSLGMQTVDDVEGIDDEAKEQIIWTREDPENQSDEFE